MRRRAGWGALMWFRLAGEGAFHAKVIEAGDEAYGAWVRAGQWCSEHLTEGASRGPWRWSSTGSPACGASSSPLGRGTSTDCSKKTATARFRCMTSSSGIRRRIRFARKGRRRRSAWPLGALRGMARRPPRRSSCLRRRSPPPRRPSRPRSAELLRADLAACGLPVDVGGAAVELKATRSSFASWLADAGVDSALRKRLMGHAARDVTEKHSTARTLAALADAVATIPLVWISGTVPGVVPVGTAIEANPRELLAPPARIGLATFGLGNRCSIH